MPLGKLGQHLLVHPTSITATVDTLERLGYVERVPHPTDRRQTLARITASGREAMEQASRRSPRALRAGRLTEDEAETLFHLLAKVRHAAERQRPPPRSPSMSGSPAVSGSPAAWFARRCPARCRVRLAPLVRLAR